MANGTTTGLCFTFQHTDSRHANCPHLACTHLVGPTWIECTNRDTPGRIFLIPPCPRATNQQRRTLGGHEVGSWRQPAPASANYPSSSSLFLPTFFDVVAFCVRACRRNVSLLTRKNSERTRNSSSLPPELHSLIHEPRN